MTSKTHDHGDWTHGHVYLGRAHERAESRTKLVTMLTALFMVVEIAAGLLFHSMALLADGVHMATHVGALGLAAGAYWLARRHANDARFSFGSGKFGDLAAFASAVILGLLAFGVAIESVRRLFEPVNVHYGDALLVAGLGLAVNVASAALLHEPHEHHAHDDHPHDHDHNLRAAYVHVLADAATSVLAIVALGCGLFFGTVWADPLVGIVGALVISSWAYGLVRASALVLLDAEDDPDLARDIKVFVEHEVGSQVFDLHLWRLGPGHRGLIVSLVSGGDADNERIKRLLVARYPSLSHVTVEISVCADCARS
ncbi:MAG: CDF family Co(II)/Ni(II) efflux transporter DmeF [Alphaproteobacteria bacterium]|nr:CDF family Co(II)/Ni(II) efflux transporter DmeF [Alphaproteobacteria bacterium]MDE2162904.1 CDF family Co(II)/Ni(II) efflux transporter DmeF [Alphaproteobacteria bacterium]MDE2267031.1 CDF family Co(II)/Ni(II) efflux transporter DmeF [Alphaproteobacteria bacterium]